MNRILEVCLVASLLVSTITPYAIAQTPAMTRGISVQMALANSAESQPDADKEDAKIITVTATGEVDFGSDPISLADLAQKVRSTPFLRRQKLYIKADARITYAKVLQVLNAARTNGIAPQVLLTAQSESSTPATIVPPKGLEVLLDPPPGTEPTAVELVDFGQKEPALKVNNQTVSYAALPSALEKLLPNKSERVVRLKAAGQLPFAEVVRSIDACHSAGAQVVLVTPNL
jgi:biopolymer transport protein ExbD